MRLVPEDSAKDQPGPARVALVGAFDRFNFGDLLFPAVLERLIGDVSQAPIDFYASVRSDLRAVGGQCTRPLKELFRPGALPEGGAVILAGGEILDASWHVTLGTLLPAFVAWLARLVPTRWSDGLCRHLSGTSLERPWVLAPEDFPEPVRVAYNCVGGSSLGKLPADVRRRIEARMARAAFVSVRDAETKALLEGGPLAGRVRLAPDCAVLVSELYPLAELRLKVALDVQDYARRFPDGYVCLQINKNLGCGQGALIAGQLEQIYRRHGLAALLLPCGRARFHEDQVALAEVHARLRTPAALAAGPLTVQDILYLIASARAYAGTSLHGSITALSYAVPHLGLTRAVPKLDAFLRTWDLPRHQCVPLEDFADRLADVLPGPRQALERQRDEVLAVSRRNFAEMFAALRVTTDPRPHANGKRGMANGYIRAECGSRDERP